MGHQHDWELTHRDGPLDMNDWRCRSCGELRQKRGRVEDKPPSDDQASPTPNRLLAPREGPTT